ncbi:carbohydrate ABC transporter permease [Agromyces ramosus]|uniref:Raffinose/stachyose/melibiose transport system permease protein n=1 Tax=Agromyces ramosus TaxID=33879 RepID=A0ABU0RD98_9MICO|nr:sugar ABC transporter permease [Agromyces ramosus]MDQ0895029.1 raffinose/stachyose/melibiose transport system permease protein [Agromyces ramosus]
MRFSAFLSVAPAAILFGTFFAVPLVVLIATSFTSWSGRSLEIVGFENYQRMITDPVFAKALGNTLFYLAIGVFVQVPLGVGVGIVLALKLRGWKTFRTLLFIPFVISGAAYALIFSMFYNPRSGLLNSILASIRISGRDWLFDSETARWAVAGTFAFILGFVMIVIMAEIASIPRELYEAARVDGASELQQQFLITLPLLRNAIGTCVLIRVLADIGMFDLVFILTAGGPDDATVSLALYAYRAYLQGDWGYANAVGTVIIGVGAILIILVRRLFRIGDR